HRHRVIRYEAPPLCGERYGVFIGRGVAESGQAVCQHPPLHGGAEASTEVRIRVVPGVIHGRERAGCRHHPGDGTAPEPSTHSHSPLLLREWDGTVRWSPRARRDYSEATGTVPEQNQPGKRLPLTARAATAITPCWRVWVVARLCERE